MGEETGPDDGNQMALELKMLVLLVTLEKSNRMQHTGQAQTVFCHFIVFFTDGVASG